MDFRNLYTVSDIVEQTNGIFSEGKLRWWIFNASSNGLSSALIRIDGRLYIDGKAFNQWLESKRLQSRPA